MVKIQSRLSFISFVTMLMVSLLSTRCFFPSLKGKSTVSTTSSSSLSFTPASGAVGTVVTLSGMDFSTLSLAQIGSTTALIVSSTSTQAQILVMPGSSYNRINITLASGQQTSADFFTVTANPSPTIQQGTKLVGTGNTGASGQGIRTALSGDGNTLAIGASSDGGNVGAVWVFTRTNGVWSQQGTKLIGTGYAAAPRQGASVSLSTDGNTLAVGGPIDNTNNGATWVFTRTAGVWTQQGAKLIGTGGIGTSQQGSSVSLSGDGNILLVGGAADNTTAGAAWIFKRTNGVWSQVGAKLLGSGGAGTGQQGYAVAMSADGKTAVIGGNGDSVGVGAVWVFTESGGIWTQQGSKLNPTGFTGTPFSGAVAVSADGDTISTGGYANNAGVGAVWVFKRTSGVWSQEGGPLIGTGYVGTSNQGTVTALSADGNTLASVGWGDNGSIGAVWLFTRSAGIWNQTGSKLTVTGMSGFASIKGLSISSDASTLAVGGNGDSASLGATWVFTP